MNEERRECQNCKSTFVIEPDDFSFYEKLKVPPPTFCPQCRKQRRLSWRNDMTLFSRKCDLCGRSIISIYGPEPPKSGKKPLTVYCQKCWWSDKWDPKSYARDYDFSRPFFEQFAELQRDVPMLAMVNDNEIASVNCEYTQDFAFSKNCYMTFIGWKVENCMYSYYLTSGKDIVDSIDSWGKDGRMYECIDAGDSFQSKYAYYSNTLLNCSFCYDCRDSSDCFMCIGLRHKKYCFKNEQYTKDDYKKILSDYHLDTFAGIERAKKEFAEFILKHPRRFSRSKNCVNCTGDYLANCKNAKFCFNVWRAEDCKWIENSDTPRGCYDLSVAGELEQCYEGITPDHSYRNFFSIFSWKNREVAYVDACHSSQNLFGCCGLKKGSYSILNKQYEKKEYETLCAKITQQMDEMPYISEVRNQTSETRRIVYKYGEFFPAELSYFAYNESAAQDSFPLEQKKAEHQGLRWRETFQMTVGKETVKPDQLPETIADVPDSITKEILACVDCKRNYKIIPRELDFYRTMNLPLPRKCFYCRHRARLNLMNPYVLYKRTCGCGGTRSKNKVFANSVSHVHKESHCPNEFETSYAPERNEIVYCEACYNSEIA